MEMRSQGACLTNRANCMDKVMEFRKNYIADWRPPSFAAFANGGIQFTIPR